MDRLEALKKAREARKSTGKRKPKPQRAIPLRFDNKYCKQINKQDQGVVKAALKGSASLKRAIGAKCLDCCAWQKNEVAKCTAVLCPLWMYRPWKHKDQRVDANGEVVLEGEMIA